MNMDKEAKQYLETADEIVSRVSQSYLQVLDDVGEQPMPVVLLSLIKFSAAIIHGLSMEEDNEEEVAELYLKGVLGMLESMKNDKKREQVIAAVQESIEELKKERDKLQERLDKLIMEKYLKMGGDIKTKGN